MICKYDIFVAISPRLAASTAALTSSHHTFRPPQAIPAITSTFGVPILLAPLLFIVLIDMVFTIIEVCMCACVFACIMCRAREVVSETVSEPVGLDAPLVL